ncbi:MAG: response regulator [Planctomycetales bacterium]|nr:response regulator [Planctomycetales bacterium]
MADPLRVLLIEDNDDDAQLVLRFLRRRFGEVRGSRADTPESLGQALSSGTWDVVLSDHGLPRLRATDALGVLAARGLDVPVILVSGHSGPEAIAEAIRAGARDFVPKWDLSRLPSVVEREVAAARGRHAQPPPSGSAGDAAAAGEVLDNAPVAVLALDEKGTLVLANRTARELLGGEVAVPGRDGRDVLPVFPADLADAGPREIASKHPDGSPLALEVEFRWVQGGGRRLLVGTLRDLSARLAVERHRAQAERIKGTAELAEDLARTLNRMFLQVLEHAHLAGSTAPLAPGLSSSLAEIARIGSRGAAFVRQLLTFAGRSSPEARTIDLNDLVSEVARGLRPILEPQVDLVLSTAMGLRPVRADPDLLEQAIVRLCLNARDAMPDGGRLLLETRHVRLEEADCRGRPEARPGDFVTLRVADNGRGMDSWVLDRLFRPFFTTKENGGSSGLGLAVVHGIVRQHGGFLDVSSEKGRGSRFRIFLPSAEGPAESLRALRGAPPRGGDETILLVESQDGERAAAARTLRDYGYRILEAADAEEAIRLFEAHQERIALVVADVVLRRLGGEEPLLRDVVLPPLPGRELARALEERKPAVRILIVRAGTRGPALTGRAETAAPTDGPEPFPLEPLAPETFARRVREVLDGARPWDRP